MTLDAEFVERAALDDVLSAATPEIAQNLGIQRIQSGPALVSLAAALPSSAIVLNRTIGLGLETPQSEASIEQLIATYRAAGIERYFVQLHPDAQPGELSKVLVRNGLEKARGWQKFSRGREPVRDIQTDLRIREIGMEDGQHFAKIVCAAFDLGDAAEPWLARVPGQPGWHIFMSFDGDKPAGCGGVYIKENVAWMDFGATAPEYRQLGSQSALLAARVQYAIDQGCQTMHTCTGEDVPGDPQHSFRNIEKLGFLQTYVRENYAPKR